MSSPDAMTQLILERINGLERAVNVRIEDVIAANARIEEKVDVAARDALAGRLIAEEAKLKVGQVHEAQKKTASQVTQLVAAESALMKYAGQPVRWKAVAVFVMGMGVFEYLMHKFVLNLP